MVVSHRILLDRLVNHKIFVAILHINVTDYPHWEMTPQLKRYYLMQSAHWCQELLVLVLRLEKPRKDYAELVAHHFVTLWLVGWVSLSWLCLSS
jgi:TLC domain